MVPVQGKVVGTEPSQPRSELYLRLLYNCVKIQFLSDLWPTNRKRTSLPCPPTPSFSCWLTLAQAHTHTGTEGSDILHDQLLRTRRWQES